MLGSQKFEKIILQITIIALVFSLIAVCFPNVFSWFSKNEDGVEYPVKLFQREVINIEISVDENDWNEMLDNKMSKPYISCDLKVDGQEFKNVGLRPKGNSSLTSVQGERISYRIDFDHYIDNQSCYGLEQLVLNNLHADATYMKDYIAYDLMAYEGVKAPLHTYAFITLNGEPFGLYLAVEVYDEDYLSRVYKDTDIKLYNVKSSGLGAFEDAIVDPENGNVVKSNGVKEAVGMGPGGPMPGGPPPQAGQPPQGKDGQAPGRPDMQMENNWGNTPPPPPGGEGGGGDLVYVGDSTDSYSNIFANAVLKHADAEDFAKVIRAINYLNKENVTNEEIERYWDVDEVLRYLAVHAFMVNEDSYTGNMKQNYYLAESNGKITVLPWDYNLSFGAFGGGPGGMPPGMQDRNNGGNIERPAMNDKTTEAINHAIDTPTFGVDMDSRPLVSVLLSRDEYKKKYHQYLDHLTKYASGEFIDKLESVEKAIYPYIKKETVYFFTPEAHKKAFDVLKKFLNLRCQSIQGQLNGKISSVTDKQNGTDLIKADFSIEEMGSMGGPGGGPPMPNGIGANGHGNMMPPPPPQGMQGENRPGNMMPPPPPGMPEMMQTQNNTGYYVTIVIALLILCIVLIGAKLFKRNY